MSNSKIHILIMPGEERLHKKRLFDALELAYPVQFFTQQDGSIHYDGAIIFDPQKAHSIPEGCPALIYDSPTDSNNNNDDRKKPIAFSSHPNLDYRLRNKIMMDSRLGNPTPLTPQSGDTVFAVSHDTPIWLYHHTHHSWQYRVSCHLSEIAHHHCLKHYLNRDSFFALLVLIHFLRDLGVEQDWIKPPIRACFLIDDPNLHFPSYGFLDYNAICTSAKIHNYHVSLAMVPLDTWYYNSSVAKLFRENQKYFSLIIHGNNHQKYELDRWQSENEIRLQLAQVLKRTSSFEKRTGLTIERFMSAPHGVCSKEVIQEMHHLGFDGLVIDRPYPWYTTKQNPIVPENSFLAGWQPSEWVADGFPIIPRVIQSISNDELILRAFLDQPIILYGHHNDYIDGIDKFEEQTNQINKIADVHWCSIKEISQSNYWSKMNDNTFHIKTFSRNIRISPFKHVSNINFEIPQIHKYKHIKTQSINCNGFNVQANVASHLNPSINYEQNRNVFNIAIHPSVTIDWMHCPQPKFSIWSCLRRCITASRDRIHPIIYKIKYRRTSVIPTQCKPKVQHINLSFK